MSTEVTREEIKDVLRQMADCFYQDRNDEGMAAVLDAAAWIGHYQELNAFVNPLFDALEQKDFILAADIIQHEMVERL